MPLANISFSTKAIDLTSSSIKNPSRLRLPTEKITRSLAVNDRLSTVLVISSLDLGFQSRISSPVDSVAGGRARWTRRIVVFKESPNSSIAPLAIARPISELPPNRITRLNLLGEIFERCAEKFMVGCQIPRV